MRTILRPVGRGRQWAAKAWPALLVILVLSTLLVSCSQGGDVPANMNRLRARAEDAAQRLAAEFERLAQPLARELRGLGEASGRLFGGFADSFR